MLIIKGIDEVIEKFKELKEEVRNLGDELYANLETDTIPLAKALAPVKTGALRESIDIDRLGPTTFVVYADVPYAMYQERGFVHEKTGQFIMNPFLEPAFEATIPEIERKMKIKILWRFR